MKLKKQLSVLASIALAGAMGAFVTSCDDKADDWFILSVGSYQIDYNKEGYWTKCYDTNPVATLNLGPVLLSHTAEASEWGGSWQGFCPSRSDDNADYPASERWMHQWASITGTDSNDYVSGYLLACWDVAEPLNTIPANPSLKISMIGGNSFNPATVDITNSAYAYYTMLNGSDFSEPFDALSETIVHFVGVKNGQKTGAVKAYLARNGKILDKWTTVDLTPLGNVDYIYCQMESTDTGAWGMNVPAYFCLDTLMLSYEND